MLDIITFENLKFMLMLMLYVISFENWEKSRVINGGQFEMRYSKQLHYPVI